jgi:hypothetical protein
VLWEGKVVRSERNEGPERGLGWSAHLYPGRSGLSQFGQGGANGGALVGGERRWRGSRGSRGCLLQEGSARGGERAAVRFF